MMMHMSVDELQYCVLIFILLLCTKRFILFLKRMQSNNIPPSPLKLPFIGNLHQLGSNPHRSLAALSDKHGPLMMLHLGQVLTLVISSSELAKDVLRTYDHIFASRPSLKAAYFLTNGNKDIVFAPYGEYWRQMRKLCTMHLLSSKVTKSFELAREEEVAFMIAKVAKSCVSSNDSVVDMSKVLNAYSNDFVCRAVLGKLLRDENINKVFNEMIEGNVSLLSEFYVEDYFPSLAWIDELTGANARGKVLAKKWDLMFERIIQDHVDSSKNACSDEQERDFIDVLLSVQDEVSGDEEISRQEIKAILLDMFAAGTDSTYIALVWAMSELARDREVMRRLQDEVRRIAKIKGLIKEEQLSQMSYLKAVIKEVLRLHPPAPLLVIRESMEECKIENYVIPKKTRVIVNAWAIGRDAKYWDAPDEFKPERFLIDTDLDYKGNHFQFIPFGSGRRICPGMQFAMSSLELALANLVQQFDWELPYGMKSEDMDMTEIPGLTSRRKQRLDLVAKPFFI